MKPYGARHILEDTDGRQAIDVISGYGVRPGMFDMPGAIPMPGKGVNFTFMRT